MLLWCIISFCTEITWERKSSSMSSEQSSSPRSSVSVEKNTYSYTLPLFKGSPCLYPKAVKGRAKQKRQRYASINRFLFQETEVKSTHILESTALTKSKKRSLLNDHIKCICCNLTWPGATSVGSGPWWNSLCNFPECKSSTNCFSLPGTLEQIQQKHPHVYYKLSPNIQDLKCTV